MSVRLDLQTCATFAACCIWLPVASYMYMYRKNKLYFGRIWSCCCCCNAWYSCEGHPHSFVLFRHVRWDGRGVAWRVHASSSRFDVLLLIPYQFARSITTTDRVASRLPAVTFELLILQCQISNRRRDGMNATLTQTHTLTYTHPLTHSLIWWRLRPSHQFRAAGDKHCFRSHKSAVKLYHLRLWRA